MTRRYDLDWLRILLFGLLVLHHTAVGFAPFGARIYGFANDELGGPLVALAIYWSHSWRLPTLFLIAGIATWFATDRRTGLRFVGRRVARLGAPLLVGSFLLNPIAGIAITAMTGTPRDLLSTDSDWWLPMAPGNVMHLWFLANLMLYTVLLWPLYAIRTRLESRVASPLALLIILTVVTTAVAVVAKPWGAAIAGDGYQLYWYFGFFAGGYLIGANHTAVFDWCGRRAGWLIAAGLVLFAAEVVLVETARATSNALAEAYAAGGWGSAGLAPAYDAYGVTFAAVEGLNAWVWVLGALGLCARFLNRDGPWRRRLSAAVFPVYVFHFPITIIGLMLLAQVSWPWQLEFLLLAAATYTLSTLLYLAARAAGPLLWLVGGRPASRVEAA